MIRASHSRRTSFAGVVLLAVVSLLWLAAPAPAQSFGKADSAAIANYRITTEKFDAWMQASLEIAEAAKKAKPAATDGDQDGDEESAPEMPPVRTLDEMADYLVSVPMVRRAVRNARLTPREFAILNLVTLQALMADQLLREVPKAEVPKGINPANLEFIRANRAKIEARMNELRAKQQGG